MVCRHSGNDPSCSSHKDYVDPYRSYSAQPETPDKSNYNVEEVKRLNQHLVLKVSYPNCRNCVYEGNKVMVFLNTSPEEALLWKEIDPHFRDPKKVAKNAAPSPAARFPATSEGWADAIVFAQGKSK